MKRLDTDVFFSIFAEHPKRARAWWVVSVQTTDEPFTREYSVENFGTEYLFRVRIRLGFKVSQSIPPYLHQIMHDLSRTGELPEQKSIYPKVDADPGIGTIRYVLIHKDLMPESKVSTLGAVALRTKYSIRHVAGSPFKWFGLAPFNPIVEVQPLFISTRRPPRLKRVTLRKPANEGRMSENGAGLSADAADAGFGVVSQAAQSQLSAAAAAAARDAAQSSRPMRMPADGETTVVMQRITEPTAGKSADKSRGNATTTAQ